jgi:drug/metabolite transporter (DMT)-like permease
MLYLFIVSLIWAYSFGLIKTNLASIHPILISAIRLSIASLVFLPFLRPSTAPRSLRWKLAGLGAIQYGLMYVFYNLSFQYLKAYEVALFTIFTPLFVTLVNDLNQRKATPWQWLTSSLAVAGTAFIVHFGFHRPDMLLGFGLVQLSNISFAVGQVFYRKWMRTHAEIQDNQVFAILYLGAAALTLLLTVWIVPLGEIDITPMQTWTLVYLGAVASGLSFFLWNFGARRTNVGALAIFNDLKIPLSIAVSFLFFGEKTNLTELLTGAAILVAVLLLNQYIERRKPT